ncbi:hypothetical protein [Falsiroseomonas sp. HW251]
MRLRHRRAHWLAWLLLAALLPALLIAAFATGRPPPEEAPRRIAAPERPA